MTLGYSLVACACLLPVCNREVTLTSQAGWEASVTKACEAFRCCAAEALGEKKRKIKTLFVAVLH